MKTKIIEYVGRMQDGGAETILKDYALMLDKDKFDVTVVCEDYKKGSANYRILNENGIKCVYTYGKFDYTCRALARIIGPQFKARLLKKVIDEIKPDIIHIQLESLDVIRCLSNYLKNVKLIFTCQNVPEMCIGDKRPKERDACKYLLENNNLQILALQQDMADEINNMFSINNTLVFRNGIDFNRFKKVKETKQEIRKALGINEDCYLVGHIGRFAYQKNHEFLIKVFNEAVKLKDDIHLLLIGDGKLKEDVEKQISEYGIEDKVTILSHRTDIPNLLKAMDVYLFPSRFEGLSVSLVEAQVANLPCVISDRIAHETYCTKNITELSYDTDIKIWAQSCINPKGNIKDWNNIDDYDLNRIIIKLQDLYLSKN